MRFSRMKHAISEKLYFVYYLRNGVLSSEMSPKIRGLHKVQPSLALLPQLCKIHSNLLRILSKVGIFGDLCKLSLQAFGSTQSTIFACLQASSLQLSLESSRIETKESLSIILQAFCGFGILGSSLK